MAKKSFYAVRKGRSTGVFNSWAECQKVISGFSGAEYKGFGTEEEALSWLNGNTILSPDKIYKSGDAYITTYSQSVSSVGLLIPVIKDRGTVNIYTDGSFKDGIVSIGVYIESVDKEFSFYGNVACGKYATSRNVAGELLAVLAGVELAKDLGFSVFNIIYDYQGVGSWYSGEWNCNGELQAKYVSLLCNFREQNGLVYNFIKIKGHSNVVGNKHADTLAKRGKTSIYKIDADKILGGNLVVSDVGFL